MIVCTYTPDEGCKYTRSSKTAIGRPFCPGTAAADRRRLRDHPVAGALSSRNVRLSQYSASADTEVPLWPIPPVDPRVLFGIIISTTIPRLSKSSGLPVMLAGRVAAGPWWGQAVSGCGGCRAPCDAGTQLRKRRRKDRRCGPGGAGTVRR